MKVFTHTALLILLLIIPVGSALGQEEITSQLQTASALISEAKYSEARDLLLEVSSSDPDNQEIKRGLSTLLNNCGVKLLQEDRAQEGLELCRRAVELEPENVRLMLNTGSAFEKVGQYDEALTLYQDALALQDGGSREMRDTLMMIGILRYKSKEHYDAIYNFEQVLQKDPSDFTALFYKGLAEYDSGQLEQAIASLEGALEKAADEEARKNILSWLEKARSEHSVEGSFVKDQTNHFIVKFDTERRSDVVGRILENCEEAYSEVGDRMDFYPPVQTTVVIYDPGQFYSLGKPEWSAGVYDNGMIRLPINDARADMTRLRRVIFHEYTHLVVNYLAKGKHVPQWLNEGLADTNSDDPPGFTDLAILRRSLASPAIDLTKLEGAFMGIQDRATVSLVYTTSYLAVKYLIDQSGYETIMSMIKGLGEGLAISECFSQHAGMEYEAFRRNFSEWLRENYK